MENKTKELFDKICNWEQETGESFIDYFMHDHVLDSFWAFWLIGKGYHERGNKIVELLVAGETCLDQALLYQVHSAIIVDDYGIDVEPFDTELFDKDAMLWAEFLTATPHYYNRITTWFKENENKE
jgi:hypothetical protein